MGYISDVKTERAERYYEIFLFVTPPPNETKLTEVIFNRELSKEFRSKYQEKFGRVDSESAVYQSSRFDMNENLKNRPLAIEAELKERRQFGEFMTKRLTEWHVDNYIKSKPQMRKVYELKEKLSHMEVEVTKESKMDLRYSLAGNTLDVIYDNPWIDSKLAVEMDPGAFGPSQVQENRVWLGKNLNKKTRVNTNVATEDGIFTLEFIHMFKENLAGLMGGSTYTKPEGKTPRESKVALGLSHSF
ncbi:MAG: hypothetical protein BroJett040_04160 [Oligoflexia bacterium]|nr:MAG: hypothetical protein BroJett040_04160 [Oligoflexia bacterium]